MNVLDKLRLDGWQNPLTGLGTALFDKTMSALHLRTDARGRRRDEYWEDLYDEDGLARRIAEKLPDEMIRGGFDLSMGDDPDARDVASRLLGELERLGATAHIKDGMVWERVFGGSAVVIGADDRSADPSLPLNETGLRQITHLTAVDKPRIRASRWYPGTHAKGGHPETYVIDSLGGEKGGPPIEVHESRLLIFPGGRVTHRRRVEQLGWGQSVLASVHDILSQYNLSWSALTHMLQSANQEVWTMKGYLAAIAGGSDAMTEYFATRMSFSAAQAGPNRALIIDADGEKYERFPSEFTGVPETVQQLAQRVSAVTDMPMTILFGMSPAGLNATGESDLQWWYETAAAKQSEKLAPQLKRLIRLLMLAKDGPTRGKALDNWAIRFRPLKQLTAADLEAMRKVVADRDALYVLHGVLTPEEVAINRFRAEGWSAETKIDIAAREAILAADLAATDDEPDDTEVDDDDAPTAPTEPSAPGAPSDPAVQDTALNGAQVSSLLEIIQAVAANQIPRDTGVQILVRAFQLSSDEASVLMGTVGAGFQPAAPPPPTNQPPPPPATGDES